MFGKALMKTAQWTGFSLVLAAYLISVVQLSGL